MVGPIARRVTLDDVDVAMDRRTRLFDGHRPARRGMVAALPAILPAGQEMHRTAKKRRRRRVKRVAAPGLSPLLLNGIRLGGFRGPVGNWQAVNPAGGGHAFVSPIAIVATMTIRPAGRSGHK
jgi:hypothetical protein